ncbi:MAG: hypothetical protein ACLPY5_14375 [Candidatus Bathyarchaeia archaeon]
MRPDDLMIGSVCGQCDKGKLHPLGSPRGWEKLPNNARSYDLKLQCDACGAVLTISGFQLPQWASVHKMQP